MVVGVGMRWSVMGVDSCGGGIWCGGKRLWGEFGVGVDSGGGR